MELFYDEVDSPVGPLLIVVDQSTAIRIDYGTMNELRDRLIQWAERYLTEAKFIHEPAKTSHISKELDEYFSGKRQSFTFSFKCYGTEYQKMVWEALYSGVPFGTTKTYKDIAIAIDNPKSVRAVGGAVGKNPFSIVIPCHRIIGTNGKMVGYNGGLDKKKILLKLEQ